MNIFNKCLSLVVACSCCFSMVVVADDGTPDKMFCEKYCDKDISGVEWACKDKKSGNFLQKNTCKWDQDNGYVWEKASSYVESDLCNELVDLTDLQGKDSKGKSLFLPQTNYNTSCKFEDDGKTKVRLCPTRLICIKKGQPAKKPGPKPQAKPKWCGIECKDETLDNTFTCRKKYTDIFDIKNTCIKTGDEYKWTGETAFISEKACDGDARDTKKFKNLGSNDAEMQWLFLMPPDAKNWAWDGFLQAYNIKNICHESIAPVDIVADEYKTWCGIKCSPGLLKGTTSNTWVCGNRTTMLYDKKNTCTCSGDKCNWEEKESDFYANICTDANKRTMHALTNGTKNGKDAGENDLYVISGSVNETTYLATNLCYEVKTPDPEPDPEPYIDPVDEECYYTYFAMIKCPDAANLHKEYFTIKLDKEDCDLASFGAEQTAKYKSEFDKKKKEWVEKNCKSVVVGPDPNQQQLTKSIKKIDEFFAYANGNLNVWRDRDGNFNTTRLISDTTAGVVLGTVGGIVSGKVIKKKQLEKGFDALHCVVGGQKMADYGDTFQVSFHR